MDERRSRWAGRHGLRHEAEPCVASRSTGVLKLVSMLPSKSGTSQDGCLGICTIRHRDANFTTIQDSTVQLGLPISHHRHSIASKRALLLVPMRKEIHALAATALGSQSSLIDLTVPSRLRLLNRNCCAPPNSSVEDPDFFSSLESDQNNREQKYV